MVAEVAAPPAVETIVAELRRLLPPEQVLWRDYDAPRSYGYAPRPAAR